MNFKRYKYIRNKLLELIFLSKDEVKRLFEEFTKENVKKLVID